MSPCFEVVFGSDVRKKHAVLGVKHNLPLFLQLAQQAGNCHSSGAGGIGKFLMREANTQTSALFDSLTKFLF